MDVLLLEKDGRCVWLDNKVLKGLMPMAIRNSVNPFAQRVFFNCGLDFQRFWPCWSRFKMAENSRCASSGKGQGFARR